jgi:hypothetical protein
VVVACCARVEWRVSIAAKCVKRTFLTKIRNVAKKNLAHFDPPLPGMASRLFAIQNPVS